VLDVPLRRLWVGERARQWPAPAQSAHDRASRSTSPSVTETKSRLPQRLHRSWCQYAQSLRPEYPIATETLVWHLCRCLNDDRGPWENRERNARTKAAQPGATGLRPNAEVCAYVSTEEAPSGSERSRAATPLAKRFAYSLPEVAALIGVSFAHVRNEVRRGSFTTFRSGRRRLVSKAALEANMAAK
jgi:hypothetical protein